MKTFRNICFIASGIILVALLAAGFNNELRLRETLIPAFMSKELETTIAYVGMYLLPLALIGALVAMIVLIDRD